jgi:hypothetical protein
VLLKADALRCIIVPEGHNPPLPPQSNASANSAIPACAIFADVSVTLDGRSYMCYMARRRAGSLAILLLTVIAAVGAEGPDAFAMVRSPAPCHQHGSAVPHPRPATYRCCQSGHNLAILQISAAPQSDSSQAIVPSNARPTPTASFVRHHVGNLTTSSADPPDLTPLRV